MCKSIRNVKIVLNKLDNCIILQSPPTKSEQELQEEDELALALALSQSEHENKEKEVSCVKINISM